MIRLLDAQIRVPYFRRVHHKAVAMEARQPWQHPPRKGRVPGTAGLDEQLNVQVGDLFQMCGCRLPAAAAQARAEDTP